MLGIRCSFSVLVEIGVREMHVLHGITVVREDSCPTCMSELLYFIVFCVRMEYRKWYVFEVKSEVRVCSVSNVGLTSFERRIIVNLTGLISLHGMGMGLCCLGGVLVYWFMSLTGMSCV
jgi:hypothetical protein